MKEIDFGARKYSKKTANNSKPEKKEKDKDDDQAKNEKHVDDKQATVMPSGIEEQAPFVESESFEWMQNETILVDYRNQDLALRLTSVSAYLQVCMIAKDNRASLLFTASDVTYPGGVV